MHIYKELEDPLNYFVALKKKKNWEQELIA